VPYASLLVLIAPREGGNATMVFAIQMVAIFAIFYFLLIRPQRKEADRHRQMLDALKKGDEVVTAGGIIGTVVHADADRVTIKTADTTRIVVERARISRVVTAKATDKTTEGA
jgi:preprotein translocase subunit YajC